MRSKQRPRSSPSVRPNPKVSRSLHPLTTSLSTPNVQVGVSEQVRKRCEGDNALPLASAGVSTRTWKGYNSGILKSVPTLLRKKTPFRTDNVVQNERIKSGNLQPQRTPQSVRFQFGDESFTSSNNTVEEPEDISARASILKALREFHFQVKLPKSKSDSSSSSSTTEGRISNFIQIKSKSSVDSRFKEEKEIGLTKASMDRCEQLLLAKLLASKYEKEGKFKKLPAQQQKKRVRIKENLHERMFQTHEKQNKILEKLRVENPSLLKQIDMNSSQENKVSSNSISESLLTPMLTPPLPVRKKLNVVSLKDEGSDINSPSINTPSKSASEKLENVRKMITQLGQNHDVTDCSELEDFVVSEQIVKKILGEPCITEVSTPEWPTPFSINSDKSQEVEVEKVLKNVELQVVPEELEKFDLSELESSLGSILEIISEGEFIRSEVKSPGEISQYFSPGYQNFVLNRTL
ncbi:unnamed protein product [Allacma fusca]|uniref:Uncharacterized protein n=1 Tax=Allacma fusca TaxID=39272 RepID=A0A8J2KF06_9HEXA|nr:unnamed protein product [Allacma fusca]